MINVSGKQNPLNLNRAATIVNVSSLNEVNPVHLIGLLQANLQILRSIFELEVPNIRTEKLNRIARSDGRALSADSKAMFDCLTLETEGDVPMYLTMASLDYQGLKDDRLYIVAGGTRGIGLKTVEWMASRGKNLSPS